MCGERGRHQHAPFRPLRSTLKCHAGLGGEAIGLLGVTTNTGGDDVLPTGDATAIARNDMV